MTDDTTQEREGDILKRLDGALVRFADESEVEAAARRCKVIIDAEQEIFRLRWCLARIAAYEVSGSAYENEQMLLDCIETARDEMEQSK
jgi:hypothetical protein